MRRAFRRLRGKLRLVVLTISVVTLLTVGLAAAAGLFRRGPASEALARRWEPTHPPVTPSRLVPATFPASGPGTWQFADTESAVFGTAGPVRRFRVAVESGVPYPVADFAAKVDAVLGDRRSWIAGGEFRLQRVPAAAHAMHKEIRDAQSRERRERQRPRANGQAGKRLRAAGLRYLPHPLAAGQQTDT